jgi:hypothetical protein
VPRAAPMMSFMLRFFGGCCGCMAGYSGGGGGGL